MARWSLVAAWLATLALFFGCSPSQAERWFIHYGSDVPHSALTSSALAIVEPDNFNPATFPGLKIKLIAYLSVGEVSEDRWYWGEIKDKPFVLASNPRWPRAHRVDPRAEVWQRLLLEQLIPAILQKGFDGLFLDTLDTALYLEKKDSKRFVGTRGAMIGLIREIRRRYPKLILIPNNGFEFLESYGDVIDGVAVEDLYIRWDFDRKKPVKTLLVDDLAKEAYLDTFKARYQKPVYNILYGVDPKDPLAQYGIQKSKRKKYLWYLGPIDLMQLGAMPD